MLSIPNKHIIQTSPLLDQNKWQEKIWSELTSKQLGSIYSIKLTESGKLLNILKLCSEVKHMFFEEVYEFSLTHMNMKQFSFNMIHNLISFLFSSNIERKVLSKELAKTSTKFSAKYRILPINTIYFVKDLISWRGKGNRKKRKNINMFIDIIMGQKLC